MREKGRQRLRKLRFFLDALLALLLLAGVFLALADRAYTEDARFRRAEKAALAGPGKILDRFDLPEHWPGVDYRRLLIADDGEEILFFPVYENPNPLLGYGSIFRREKTDGLLLTTLPSWGYMAYGDKHTAVPLFLFADDPRAVGAEVTLRLSDDVVIELRQGRGGREIPRKDGDGYYREAFFLFNIPVPENPASRSWTLLEELAKSNSWSMTVSAQFSASIRLYDVSGALLETREYVILSPGLTRAA